MSMTTWRDEITGALEANDETWGDVEACTLSPEELDREFDGGFGEVLGVPFTLWTKKAVYFPCSYDGAEWCGFVSRHPDGKPTSHMGSG